VLTLSSLSRDELQKSLAKDGLRFQTGAFVACVTSPISHVADGLERLYGAYPLRDKHDFADFYLNLVPVGGLRRWFKPQVQFDHDGLRPFQPLPRNQAFSMFEWALNWCVSGRAHRYLIIHAAVVEKNGRAAILPAPPGSGKSTLCAALVSRGWRLLSDELTLIRLDDGQVVPSPRPISLKNGSIELIGNYAPGTVFSRPVADTAKGTIAHMRAPTESVRRAHETAQTGWIVFPRYVADAAPALIPLPRARAFLKVAENAFNYSLLGAAGFKAVGTMVEAADTFDFSYSALDDAIAVFEQLAGQAA
jgi:HprK-related kinase A